MYLTQDAEMKSKLVCEGALLSINCDLPGQKIKILSANYGRSSTIPCGPNNWDTSCTSPSSLFIVKAL